MREQAFIVYDNVASATAAMRSLNGFNFYNNPLVRRAFSFFPERMGYWSIGQKIQYSKTKSHAVAKLDGTFRLQTVEERKKAANNVNAVGKRSQDGQESEQASKRARNEEESESEEDED